MRRYPQKVTVALIVLLAAGGLFADGESLWYLHPAQDWHEALPLGNGRVGVMAFGGVHRERICINEETIWSKASQAAFVGDAYFRAKAMQDQLIAQGRYSEATEVFKDISTRRKNVFGPDASDNQHIEGTTTQKHAYQLLGNLYLHFPNEGVTETDYRRELHLDRAVHTVSYTIGATTYLREYFCSYPDQVFVMLLKADAPGKISFSLTMDRPMTVGVENQNAYLRDGWRIPDTYPARFEVAGADKAYFTGQASENGVRFEAGVQIVAAGGTYIRGHDRLTVGNADQAMILFDAQTHFSVDDPRRVIDEHLTEAANKGYEKLLADHQADHRALYDNVDISLGNPTIADSLPLDVRLRAYQLKVRDRRAKRSGSYDSGLQSLLFQYNRYLLIASNRRDRLPAGLVFWNGSLYAPWYGRHTTNVNQQMNLWGVEQAGLGELQLSQFDQLLRYMPAGRALAETVFDSRGLVYPGRGLSIHGPEFIYDEWNDAAGWFAQHFWEHYLFSGDKDFLREKAYPYMKQCALFYLDQLRETADGNHLMPPPGASPENSFVDPTTGKTALVDDSTTITRAIVSELFANTATAATELGCDREFADELLAKRERLSPYRVNSAGILQEWYNDHEECEPGHRHFSHLYPVYPGCELTPQTQPELTEAARKSLLRRLTHGSGNVGWSKAWALCLAARFQDGPLAYQQLDEFIEDHLFPNLFGAHQRHDGKIFAYCLDASGGTLAGMCEMLLQSHQGVLEILPAVSFAAWPEGKVTGLRARGGYEVDIYWSNSALQKVVIRSVGQTDCSVRYRGKTVILPMEPGETAILDGELN